MSSPTSFPAFSWGHVISELSLDFDGQVMRVTKFHPWKKAGSLVEPGSADFAVVEYRCEELCKSSQSLFYLVLAWMTYRQLGSNHDALVVGLGKALDLC